MYAASQRPLCEIWGHVGGEDVIFASALNMELLCSSETLVPTLQAHMMIQPSRSTLQWPLWLPDSGGPGYRPVAGSCKYDNGPCRSIKKNEFLD
jgi:hypothetical protein